MMVQFVLQSSTMQYTISIRGYTNTDDDSFDQIKVMGSINHHVNLVFVSDFFLEFFFFDNFSIYSVWQNIYIKMFDESKLPCD